MAIANIDFPTWSFPQGFNKKLKSSFNILTIDMYATASFTDEHIMEFTSDENYVLKRQGNTEEVGYRELGRFELLDGLFVDGDYFDSFFIVKNEFQNGRNQKVTLAALLYVDRNNFHIWYPWFEELFRPLIEDDIKNNTNKHLINLRAIQRDCSKDLDIVDIVINSNVDYIIEHSITGCFNTGVFYSLIKHIFIMEDEKFPAIPGSKRTLEAYEQLYNNYISGNPNLDEWRTKYRLDNPGW